MKLFLRFTAAVFMFSTSFSFGQVGKHETAAKPLPPPTSSHSTIPATAHKSVDVSGRTVVGTDAQKFSLFDPEFGAVGAGSHHPPRFNAQQMAAASLTWHTYSPDEQKKRMAMMSEKIKEAHLAYIKEHPEKAFDKLQSSLAQTKGFADVPINGTKLRLSVNGRESDVPFSFRDISGKRVLRAPALVKFSPSAPIVMASSINQTEIPAAAPTVSTRNWHKLDAVMKRNVKTGEQIAFLRLAKQQFGGPSPVCPAWGCGPCPPYACQVVSTGGDSDGDGIPDDLEASLAASFTPTYHISNYEQPGTGFAIMQDAVPETVQTAYGPTPPISYYRVEPSSFIDTTQDASGNSIYHRYLRIDYLTLWNEDDGLAHGVTCDLAVGGSLRAAVNFLAGVLGFDIAAVTAKLGGHYLDNEHAAVLLAVQVNSPNDMILPSDYTKYSAVRYFSAAHENTIVDGSEYMTPSSPLPHDSHLDLYLSQSKHSTYFYNPDRKPILITRAELDYIEAALIPLTAFGVQYDYYDQCPVSDPNNYYVVLPDGEIYFGIDYGDGSCDLPFVYFDPAFLAEAELLTEEVFADCLGEHFTDVGPKFAQQMINVGEPSNPTTGNHFIQDSTADYAGSKLRESIFPQQQL